MKVAELGSEHKASDVTNDLTISVGAAIMWPNAPNQLDPRAGAADDALYESKSQGRNRATVYHVERQLGATLPVA